jgi:hypothetical protein
MLMGTHTPSQSAILGSPLNRHTPDASARARQHVAFRASTVLLALTVGELLLTFEVFRASNSSFVGHEEEMMVGGALALAVGLWQMVITRRLDYYVVNPPTK